MSSNPNAAYADMAIHAEALDFDELNNLVSLLPDDSTTCIERPPSPTSESNGISDTQTDTDDILPEESFSTHPSPAGSQVNGKVYRKPPISIFQTDHTALEPLKPETSSQSSPSTTQPVQNDTSAFPSPPETPPVVDHARDDVPARYSDIEGTPPLRAAGFVGDEIPHVDPLDSDGEWTGLAEMSKKFAVAQQDDDPNQLRLVEEGRKKKKKKKKSKGVQSPFL
jgi:hypothetical protein